MANGAAQRQRAIKPLADLMNQGKRALHTRMATSASSHRDQAVSALFNRLVGIGVVDDVVHDDAAPTVHGVVDVGARAQRGNDKRNFVAGAHRHVGLKTVIGLVHDLVDGIRRRRRLRVRTVPGGEAFSDLSQPVFKLRRGPGVERGHRAHHAGRALRDDELGVADDEQRRSNDREFQVLKNGRQRHQKDSSERAVTEAAPSTMLSRKALALLRMCSA